MTIEWQTHEYRHQDKWKLWFTHHEGSQSLWIAHPNKLSTFARTVQATERQNLTFSSPFLSKRRGSTLVEEEAAAAAVATTVTKEFASKLVSPLLLDSNCDSGTGFADSVSISLESPSEDVLLNVWRVSSFPSEEDDRQSMVPWKSSHHREGYEHCYLSRTRLLTESQYRYARLTLVSWGVI